ncbi:MAG: phosphoglycerate kinase [Chitinispirillia bacterium]|jgi:phosphoglycerate kinase
MTNKLFIEDLNVAGKTVLVRVDFNVPLDGNQIITNDKRIVASLPTITYLAKNKAKVILVSHLGRPKGKRIPEFSLKPVADDLKTRMGDVVTFINDCIGPDVENAIANMDEGSIVLLENLRFYNEETENDPEFSKKLASCADLYVNDAFGTAHRAHSSTVGVTQFIDKCAAGYLINKELNFLGKSLENPKRPFIAILGGAKISGKIDVINNLLGKVDNLIIGGGMAYTFFKAQGLEIGNSLLEEDKIDIARNVMQNAEKKGTNLLLPVDCVCGYDFSNETERKTVSTNEIPADMEGMDIGPKTIELFSDVLLKGKTIVWNGPMGVFEFGNFAGGTNSIAQILARCTEKGAVTIIGGGDSASAIEKAGLSDKMSHISTGGGASLEFLEGKVLPGIAALSDR